MSVFLNQTLFWIIFSILATDFFFPEMNLSASLLKHKWTIELAVCNGANHLYYWISLLSSCHLMVDSLSAAWHHLAALNVPTMLMIWSLLPQTHGWWNHLGYLRYVPTIFLAILMVFIVIFWDFLLVKWILCFVSLETICSKQIFSASTTTIETSLLF